MVNGEKVTGQKVTKLLGQNVTMYMFYPGGQKVTIYIVYPSGQKVTGKVTTYILLNMYVGRTKSHNMYIYTYIHVRYVGRTESHNMYTLIHVCIIG